MLKYRNPNSTLHVVQEKIEIPKMEDYNGPYNVRSAETRKKE